MGLISKPLDKSSNYKKKQKEEAPRPPSEKGENINPLPASPLKGRGIEFLDLCKGLCVRSGLYLTQVDLTHLSFWTMLTWVPIGRTWARKSRYHS